MAFTIGMPDNRPQQKHIALRPGDLLRVLLGSGAQRESIRHGDGEAERRTARVLGNLPENYVVFNGFRPLERGGVPAKWWIDHVVIGPSGIFAIETECFGEHHVSPAALNRATAHSVRSIQRRSIDFKEALSRWSCGSFDEIFIKPMLVYAHENAYVEKLQEGAVKVIPLRWLATEVTERTFEQLTPDQVYRVAHTLFDQLPESLQQTARPELDRLGLIAHAWLAQRVCPQYVGLSATHP